MNPEEKLPEVIKAPDWLVERMKKLREMPPPTREQVEAQIEACRNHGWDWTKKLPDSYS